MAQVSSNDVVNLFKKVYGDLRDLQPEDYQLQKDIPFSVKEKVGESYSEAMVLTSETGWTLGGSGAEAFDLNPAIAGTVKQTLVNAYTSILASVVPWGVLSRSAGGGERAFFDGTKHIVRNNLKSHGKLLEILRLYGQATSLLGYVSYATATYRGVAFTNGTGTLNGVAFTNGINTSSKAILLSPGQFASGIWVGSEGAVVNQVNSSGAVVASGKLVQVDADYGILYVDFTPIAASSTTSHRLCFQGQEALKDMIGIQPILSASGSLFGINTAAYSLWKGITVNCSAQKFSFDFLQMGIASAVNRGGLDGDVKVYLNPRTWGKLISTEAGKRVYDSSYKSSSAESGAESITFYHQAGKAEIVAHRMVKEGDCFALSLSDWTRSGSSEISFTVPGINKEIIFPLENSAAMAFRSFSDQYIFCHAPARSVYFSNINDESAT
jgi:hypothetical protein